MSEERSDESTTLDYIDGIVVQGHPFREPANEYYTLISLAAGLEFLYQQVSRYEEHAVQRLSPIGKRQFTMSSNHPALEGFPDALLHCAFRWYSVSACDYVRMVGSIACRNDPSRTTRPVDYVRNVVPEVLAFRDKVGAHAAWTMKSAHDCHAERELSVMPTLTFQTNRFVIPGWTLAFRSSGDESDTSAIPPWSLTEVHDRLRQRYWPDTGADHANTPGAT